MLPCNRQSGYGKKGGWKVNGAILASGKTPHAASGLGLVVTGAGQRLAKIGAGSAERQSIKARHLNLGNGQLESIGFVSLTWPFPGSAGPSAGRPAPVLQLVRRPLPDAYALPALFVY
jgi:hypothetical protein